MCFLIFLSDIGCCFFVFIISHCLFFDIQNFISVFIHWYRSQTCRKKVTLRQWYEIYSCQVLVTPSRGQQQSFSQDKVCRKGDLANFPYKGIPTTSEDVWYHSHRIAGYNCVHVFPNNNRTCAFLENGKVKASEQCRAAGVALLQ